jgi:hypothetical protein
MAEWGQLCRFFQIIASHNFFNLSVCSCIVRRSLCLPVTPAFKPPYQTGIVNVTDAPGPSLFSTQTKAPSFWARVNINL